MYLQLKFYIIWVAALDQVLITNVALDWEMLGTPDLYY